MCKQISNFILNEVFGDLATIKNYAWVTQNARCHGYHTTKQYPVLQLYAAKRN